MITKEVYVEIEVLRKHGFSLRKIAAEVGCAVNTVRSHLAQGNEPRYQRQKKRATKLSTHETYLCERQAAVQPQWIPTTVLFREISALGYAGGVSQLRAFMRTIRPQGAADPVVRFETAPGEQLQIDWVEFRKGSDPLYAFSATLGYSRVLRPAIFQPLRPELFRGETKGKSHAVVGRSWPGIRVGQGAYRDRGSLGGKRQGSSGSYKFL
jgi:transposase